MLNKPAQTDNAHISYFQSDVVDDRRLAEQIYRLRYDVYCHERGFLDPADYPDKCESDEFDPHSAHFATIHNDGNIAGTMRLIRYSELEFPILQHCRLDPAIRDSLSDMSRCAEISRLAVSKRYRKRLDDNIYGYTVNTSEGEQYTERFRADEHRKPVLGQPAIVLNLYRCMYHESRRLGITHWLVAMEKSLHRLLNRVHFHFQPIGEEVDYYGPVTPYIASIARIEEDVKTNNPELYYYMQNSQ